MRHFLWLFVIALVVSVPRATLAQTPEPIVSYTVAVFNAATTDPNTGTPVQTAVTYPLTSAACALAKVPPPTTSPTNPQHLRFDDPANPTQADCDINVGMQIGAIPVGTGYKVAARANGATTQSTWSNLSNPFNRTAVAPAALSGVKVLP